MKRTLHNDEIRVVDIELNGLEDVLNGGLGRSMTTDEIFTRSVECDLFKRNSAFSFEIRLHNPTSSEHDV